MTYNSRYIEVHFNELPASERKALATAVRDNDWETAQRIIYDAFRAEHPLYDPAQASHALVYVYPVSGLAPWFTVSERGVGVNDFDPGQKERVMAALDAPREPVPLGWATAKKDNALGASNWEVSHV